MIRTTPFHERTSALNETGLWSHWAGHLAANRYQDSDKFEYFAVRNSAGPPKSAAIAAPGKKSRCRMTRSPSSSGSRRWWRR